MRVLIHRRASGSLPLQAFAYPKCASHFNASLVLRRASGSLPLQAPPIQNVRPTLREAWRGKVLLARMRVLILRRASGSLPLQASPIQNVRPTLTRPDPPTGKREIAPPGFAYPKCASHFTRSVEGQGPPCPNARPCPSRLRLSKMCVPKAQNSAVPGVRGKGMTSRMFPTPVMNMRSRSKPRPNPACGTLP